jgi:hypothetical protein
MEISPKQTRNSGAYVGATLLILIGLFALMANLGGPRIGEEAVPLGVGIAFMVAYALTRRYGFLVPGGILTGVGGGIWIASLVGASDNGPYAVIGGGLGFLLIYALDILLSGRAARWWPVVPGVVMLVVGSGMATGDQELVRQIGIWSPLLLIALGIWILVARGRQQSH